MMSAWFVWGLLTHDKKWQQLSPAQFAVVTILCVATGQKQLWNPAVESEALLQLAKLCPDHTLVGMKLLEKISSVPRGELACSE